MRRSFLALWTAFYWLRRAVPRRAAIVRTRRILEASGAKILGMAVSKLDPLRPGYGYSPIRSTPTNDAVARGSRELVPVNAPLWKSRNANADTTAIMESQTGAELLELEVPSPPSVPGWFARTTLGNGYRFWRNLHFVQAVVQVLGFAAGLLIVRACPSASMLFTPSETRCWPRSLSSRIAE